MERNLLWGNTCKKTGGLCEQSYLCITVQQPDCLVSDLQEHLLGPDFVLRVQKNQFLDGIIYCDNRLWFVHNKGGEMLRRRRLLVTADSCIKASKNKSTLLNLKIYIYWLLIELLNLCVYFKINLFALTKNWMKCLALAFYTMKLFSLAFGI